MKSRRSIWIAIAGIGSLLGLLVSAQALGMVLPWQAARADEVPSKGRVNAIAEDVNELDKRVDNLDAKFMSIDGKLDILIELNKK